MDRSLLRYAGIILPPLGAVNGPDDRLRKSR
jgi:hypothetical protein